MLWEFCSMSCLGNYEPLRSFCSFAIKILESFTSSLLFTGPRVQNCCNGATWRKQARSTTAKCIRLGHDRTSTATATADYSQTVCKAVSQHASLRSPTQRNHNGEHVRHKLGGERRLMTSGLQRICTERLATITHSPQPYAFPCRNPLGKHARIQAGALDAYSRP